MEIIKTFIEIIVGFALFINALLFIPQILSIIKKKTAAGISLTTFLGFLLIQLALVLHGFLQQDYILAGGYILSMITCGTVILLTLWYKKTSTFHVLTEEISFKEIIDQMPGHVYWKDKNGIMLGCNTNNWKDFGLSSLEDYIGKTDYDLFPKDQADDLRKADLKVLNSGETIIVEEESTTASGYVALYLSHKIPLRNRENKIIGILGVSLDITDAKKEEIERLQMLENVIAVTPGHVYWLNRDNVYLGCNNNQAKSAGLASRKEIIGKRNKDLPWNKDTIIPEQLDATNEIVMKRGKPVSIEEPSVYCNGKKATFISSKAPLRNSDGKIIGMVGVSIDITEKNEEKEAKLKEAQYKLEGMSMVSASIAHELRTPLASLNVNVDTLNHILPLLFDAYKQAKKAKLPVQPMQKGYFELLSKKLMRMDKEIKGSLTCIDILLLNLNPSSEDTKLETFNINQCVNEALERYPFMDQQQQLISWTPDEKTNFVVHGELILVIHILFNLIKNALYYVAKARKGDIKIWCDTDNNYNKLYFKDTGEGISKELQPKIFERFFSKTHHGAGVGLTFCAMVMKNLGGKIECDSIEGEYTLFTLCFPIDKGNAHEAIKN